MKKINVQQLQLIVSEILITETTEKKQKCLNCEKKAKYLFLVNSQNICSKCAIQKGITQKEIDKLYNFAYPILKNKPLQVRENKPLEKNSSPKFSNEKLGEKQLHLVNLYTEGWIHGKSEAIAEFLDQFKGLIFKYAKYTSRGNDFEDLAQFFREKILYYHQKELEKPDAKFDYSDPKNYGALVRATKEFVLQGVNLLKSKRNSLTRKFDFDYYVEINECFGVSSQNHSVEKDVHEKLLKEEIDSKLKTTLSEVGYSVYTTLLKGITKNIEVASILDISLEEVSSAKKEIKEVWRSSALSDCRMAFNS